MSLSIIIVNYNTPQLVLNCLHTVWQDGKMEVIVVDNASTDNSKTLVMAAFPKVQWIQMGYNSGFARANNAGIKAAKGDVLLLLNSDTLNENNALVQCYERFSLSTYTACSVQLLNLDRTPQISGNFFMKGGLNHLMPLPYTGQFVRWLGLAFKVKKTNVPQAEGVVDVDWINGAFLMVKRAAISKAGLLDEDFFLYSEEIEWCSRLRKAGPMCIYGDLHVVHLQGSTANEAFGSSGKGYHDLADRKGYQLMLSHMVRIRKQFGAGWFLFHLAAHIFTIPVFLIIAILKLFTGNTNEWRRWRGFTANVLGVCRYFFVILRNKPHFYKVL